MRRDGAGPGAGWRGCGAAGDTSGGDRRTRHPDVRPDGHVAWVTRAGERPDLDALRTALTTWLGPAGLHDAHVRHRPTATSDQCANSSPRRRNHAAQRADHRTEPATCPKSGTAGQDLRVDVASARPLGAGPPALPRSVSDRDQSKVLCRALQLARQVA
ncbi:hypothetical protein [Nonomuraea sp. bgisy101]|uniref:aromatic-ring hydroxylase C-terminal domain-containing protein n=1 Tax=Nonomuraea sp. bgisy101 TaxID=3413784 RepID=UPI003D74C64D